MKTVDLMHDFLICKEKEKNLKIDKKSITWALKDDILTIKYLSKNNTEEIYCIDIFDFLTYVFNKSYIDKIASRWLRMKVQYQKNEP